MPELPDVEIFRRYLDATSLHQKIEEMHAEPEILDGISAARLRKKCLHHCFERTKRHGKYLLTQVDEEGWLVLHFGMTGYLKYFKKDETAPAHIRLCFVFESGYRLAFDCTRKLGLISWAENPAEFIEKRDLGPDPLSEDFNFEKFSHALEGRRGKTKSALMNQRLFAGIGNIYSDEILFQAGVDPDKAVGDLDERKLKGIFGAMGRVLGTAIDTRAGEKGWPDTWLISRRRKGETCPLCKGKITVRKISGRSSYSCEDHQS